MGVRSDSSRGRLTASAGLGVRLLRRWRACRCRGAVRFSAFRTVRPCTSELRIGTGLRIRAGERGGALHLGKTLAQRERVGRPDERRFRPDARAVVRALQQEREVERRERKIAPGAIGRDGKHEHAPVAERPIEQEGLLGPHRDDALGGFVELAKGQPAADGERGHRDPLAQRAHEQVLRLVPGERAIALRERQFLDGGGDAGQAIPRLVGIRLGADARERR